MKDWWLDFLMFRKRVTPSLMPVLFWAGIVIALIMAIWNLTDGARTGDPRLIFHGAVLLFAGPFFVRVLCEWVLSFFHREE
ncbi:MAG: DUF4282 domain-containing protein [Candidatus Bipolaricaulota bacterium]